jgi:hypothetical protein
MKSVRITEPGRSLPPRTTRETPLSRLRCTCASVAMSYASSGFSRRRTSHIETTTRPMVNSQAPAVPCPMWKNSKPCW